MKRIISLILIAVSAFSAPGCAEKGPKKEIIAVIGSYSLNRDDFLSELSLYSPEYRGKISKEEILDNIIEKKILLLEAQKEGLDKNPDFMKMIERFWEQSLLRSLLNKKSEEILSSIPASEEDRNRKASQIMKLWIEDLKKKTKISINKNGLEKITIK